MNQETSQNVRLKMRRRDFVFRAIRSFFHKRDFVELDPPLLVPGTGCEPHIDPLTVSVAFGAGQEPVSRYLHTSPELYLKRLLARVPDPSFVLGHVFRNGERTAKHLVEFTMLEWYRPHQDLESLVRDCEQLIEKIVAVCLANQLQPDLNAVHLLSQKPFDVVTMQDLWSEYAQIDLENTLGLVADEGESAMVRIVKEAGFHLRPGADFDDAFVQVMLSAVEPNIGRERPTVVTHWPKQMAVLSRIDDENPLFALRFELYAGGFELANAFDELVDGTEQAARFEADNAKRLGLGKPALSLDRAFLSELDQMPPTAGIAFGVDRLLQLLFGLGDIAETYPLHHLG